MWQGDLHEGIIEMINLYYMLYHDSEAENLIKGALDIENPEAQVKEVQNQISTAPQPEVAATVQNVSAPQPTNNVEVEKTVSTQPQVKQEATTNNQEVQNNNQQNRKEDYRKAVISKGTKIFGGCSCKGDIFKHEDYIACNKCNFFMKAKYADISFSEYEVSQLIRKRISWYKEFTKKDGTKFKGRVHIDFDKDGNLIPNFKFVNSPKCISGHYKDLLFAPDTKEKKNTPITEFINNSYSNTSKNTNNSSSKDNDNSQVVNSFEKRNPLENMANSEKTDYEKYLEINDSSVPF